MELKYGTKTYVVSLDNQNKSTCPKCSEHRKKKTQKCLTYVKNKHTAFCNHCGAVFYDDLHKDKYNYNEIKHVYSLPPQPSITKVEVLSDNVINYFNKRCISKETLDIMRITESVEFIPQVNDKRKCINFNYFELNELVNIKYRTSDKHFKLFKNGKKILYNINSVIGAEVVYIVEGEIDCLTLIECGLKSVVSVPNGGTKGKINTDYLNLSIDYFEPNAKFVIITDIDEVGINLRNELSRRLGKENCFYIDNLLGFKDVNELLCNKGKEVVLNQLKKAKEFQIEGVFSVEDVYNDIVDLYSNGFESGYYTGIDKIDEYVSFHKGFITTITGMPNTGKSEFLDYLLVRLNIMNGTKTAYFSPENLPIKLHASKLAEKYIGKSFFDLSKYNGENNPYSRIERMNTNELNIGLRWVNEHFNFIYPDENYSVESILAIAKELVKRKGINFFVFDAWNKFEHNFNGKTEAQYTSYALDLISQFAKKYDVHCFIVAHPTKMPKDKDGKTQVPDLNNISGGMAFFAKTDIGLCFHRDREDNRTFFYVQKLRFSHWGKATGVKEVIELKYNLQNKRYAIGSVANPYVEMNNNSYLKYEENEGISINDKEYLY